MVKCRRAVTAARRITCRMRDEPGGFHENSVADTAARVRPRRALRALPQAGGAAEEGAGDALRAAGGQVRPDFGHAEEPGGPLHVARTRDRKSTRLNSSH